MEDATARETLGEQLEMMLDAFKLNALSIGITETSNGQRFVHAYAHGGGFVGASDNGFDDTPASAIQKAISDLNAKRSPAGPIPDLQAA